MEADISFFHDPIKVIKIYSSSSSSSRMAGTPMTYNSSRVKSINLKWLYFHSACPSSSNQLNPWLRLLWPIHRPRFRNEPCQLPPMTITFSATTVLCNISGFGGLATFKCPTDLPGTSPRFIIDSHNTQFQCIKCKWNDRRLAVFLFLQFFLVKKIFVSSYLTTWMDAKQWVLIILLFLLSGSGIFHNHHTT